MNRNRLGTYMTAFLVLTALTGTNAQTLSLEQALRLTLKTSPVLKARALEVQTRQADADQAASLPNPALELELQDFGRAEGTVMLSQEVELGGKRSGRTALAKSDQAIAALQLEADRIEILTEASIRFMAFWEAQEKHKYLVESAAIADSVLMVISRRVREGASPEVEKIRAEVELSGTRLQAERAGKQTAAARSRLSALWGKEAPAFEKAATWLPGELAFMDTALILGNLGKSPRMRLQGLLMEKQDKALTLARAGRFTDLEVAAGVKRDGASEETMAVLGLSVGLPLFNRNQGEIKAARLGRDVRAFENETSERALRGELGELMAMYASQLEEAETIKNSMLPGLEKAFEEVRKLYINGRTGFLDLLDIQRALLELKIEYIGTLAQLNITGIRMAALSGNAFEEILKGDE